ncbi:MAG: type II secretion system inner membrane protein GspF [Kofleriaceae bacterium]|nr:type II secretion system inner membrane protein GspF [Kofleriaceae bacterium]MCL4225243.1 type II secretion system inner membrane protein GspF [Myxococcales bacterium]
MPMWAYKGIGPSGKSVGGVRDADSPKLLRQLLKKEGVIITECTPSKQGGKRPAAGKAVAGAAAGEGGGALSKEVDLGAIFGGVKKTDIANFTRQLATLLKSGIALAEALGTLFEQTDNVRLKVPLGEVRTMVNEGSSFGDALSKHPKLFDELFVSMVKAGEVAGNLDDVLNRLADFLDSSQKLKAKVQSAMIYPVIMVVVGIAIMGVLMVAVIPEITKMFKSQGKVLPLNTRFLIWVADTIRDYLLWIVLFWAGAIWGFRAWIKSEGGREVWHRWILRMPMIGDLARKINVARFARTLGTMLQSGVPMLRALDTAKQIMANVVMRKAVEDAKQAVTEGESLALTLKRSGQFPAMMTHMVAVGERAGALEQMLERVAETYENEVDLRLGRATAMLEPLMLVGMGGAVAFIVFSILQPIMGMGQFK